MPDSHFAFILHAKPSLLLPLMKNEYALHAEMYSVNIIIVPPRFSYEDSWFHLVQVPKSQLQRHTYADICISILFTATYCTKKIYKKKNSLSIIIMSIIIGRLFLLFNSKHYISNGETKAFRTFINSIWIIYASYTSSISLCFV